MPPDRDEDKGFTVTDRRQFTNSGEPARAENDEAPAAAPPPDAAEARPADAPAAARPKRPAPLPEIDFPTFVLSLGTSALYHLGEVPGPEGKTAEPNLPLAKQTIDILALLRDKTKGNLVQDEAQFLDSLLYDLRMKYVTATRK